MYTMLEKSYPMSSVKRYISVPALLQKRPEPQDSSNCNQDQSPSRSPVLNQSQSTKIAALLRGRPNL